MAIVGLGLIGGSIALAARRQWPTGLVIAVDKKAALEQAIARQAIDVGADDLVVIREADLVVLASVESQNLAMIGELGAHVPGWAVVTDTGSTKRALVAAAATLPPRFAFVGGHPLVGGAGDGLAAARPDLFSGRLWLLAPRAGTSPAVTERLRAFVRGLGAEPRMVEPEAYDRVLASLGGPTQYAPDSDQPQ
jgi:prephenate dehydrogenase